MVKDVRGLGLILAIEFFNEKKAKKFSSLCLKKGLLVLLTEKFNIRLLPPLNVKKTEIVESLKIMDEVMEEINE